MAVSGRIRDLVNELRQELKPSPQVRIADANRRSIDDLLESLDLQAQWLEDYTKHQEGDKE